jgi:subtilisin family serine protease
MSKIDSRLRFLQQESRDTLTELEALGRFAIEAAQVPSPKATVLLQYRGDLADLEQRGFETRTVAGDVASGMVELNRLDEIVDSDSVVRVESARPLDSELDLSLPEVRADLVHTGPPGFRGAGVIVGIIDSGIDFTHECFREAGGTSRIAAIWDQNLAPAGNESSPSGFPFGVEYTKSDIDAALAVSDPFSVVRHRDGDIGSGHGTHVAGIAAGDGSVEGNGQPAFTFVGMAPEATILMVANRSEGAALGDSASTLDAVAYIFDKASSLRKPVVINQSQGDNLGPHDGTSLLERGIDNLLGQPGRSMVKSAGNAGSDRIHASGTVSSGQTETVQFEVPPGDFTTDALDIWYPGADRFDITILAPDGNSTDVVNPDTTATFDLPNGNRVFVDSVLNDPNNNDNRIFIQLLPGSSSVVQQGTWAFTLDGTSVGNGRFDAWIQRGPPIPRFVGPHEDSSRTVSVPGTSREIISVASFITKGPGVGNISTFSSRGPTRDGRRQPVIAAPGQHIMSARALDISSGSDRYHLLQGTSMAAPHITGIVALMLQKNPGLTQSQISDCLTRTAHADGFTQAVPNDTWGHGKVDAQASVGLCPDPP